jgi:putative ABC transport system permease protein
MFRNHIKIAWRTLYDHKLYSLLNIAGLTFGLTWFFLIGLFLYDELTFDQQHTKADRIYRVVEYKKTNNESTVIAAAGFKLAQESKNKIAGVENTTRVQRTGRANLVDPAKPVPFQETVTMADENFLRIFDFPLIAGDRATALREPNSIVVDEELAKRLFGNTDVLGKTIQWSHLPSPAKITGVMKKLPSNSSFSFNSLTSEATNYNFDNFKNNVMTSDWLSNNFTVYALLKPGIDPKTVSTNMEKMVRENITVPAGTDFSFSLQSLKDMHLGSEGIIDGARNTNVDAMPQGSVFYIKLFSFIAFFVLLIAGINYTNLTTARASSRLKEIGVRKTIGALRSNLFWQFLIESLMVTFISFVLALIAVNLILPAFNDYTGKQVSLGLSTDYRVWTMAVGFTLLAGLLSGCYPAIMLSRFRPVSLLKGLKIQQKGNLSLRKSLVVFQFTVSIIMIAATMVVYLQVRFLNDTNIGFNKDLLVVIDVNTGAARTNWEWAKSEMAKIPTVKSVSVTSRVPGEWKTYRMIKVRPQGNTGEGKTSYMFGADKDFMSTYEMSMVKGRNFNSHNDSGSVIVNETAAKMLGITEPSEQLLEFTAVSRGEGAFQELQNPWTPRVIGIVKDFNFQSLRSKVEPMILAYNINPIHGIDYYTVRIDANNIESTLEKLKAVMVKNAAHDPFEYHFLDDQLALFYVEDQRRQTLLIWVALATVFIACLGLFGLATYAAVQRVKEIGVRKVLGATVFNLASLLSKDFLKLVLIANGIAFPVAWWATNKWLQEYAYHIDIEWWVFALSGAAALLIAIVTVSYQAIRAAMGNPVKSLRTE